MNKNFEGASRLHLALNTNHFEDSIEFYEALFNTQPSKIKPGYAKFELINPPPKPYIESCKRSFREPAEPLRH